MITTEGSESRVVEALSAGAPGLPAQTIHSGTSEGARGSTCRSHRMTTGISSYHPHLIRAGLSTRAVTGVVFIARHFETKNAENTLESALQVSV
jgi:hypothetical protein